MQKKGAINVHARGQLFKMDLICDVDCFTMIEGICYTEETDKFFGKIQEGKSYFIKGAIVETANKKFTAIKNDFRLIIKLTTEISEAAGLQPKRSIALKQNTIKIKEVISG